MEVRAAGGSASSSASALPSPPSSAVGAGVSPMGAPSLARVPVPLARTAAPSSPVWSNNEPLVMKPPSPTPPCFTQPASTAALRSGRGSPSPSSPPPPEIWTMDSGMAGSRYCGSSSSCAGAARGLTCVTATGWWDDAPGTSPSGNVGGS